MAQKFEKLRESTTPHSMKANHKEIKKAFGKSIEEIFDEFDEVPLASGSVA